MPRTAWRNWLLLSLGPSFEQMAWSLLSCQTEHIPRTGKEELTRGANADIGLAPQISALGPSGRVQVIELSGREAIFAPNRVAVVITRDEVPFIACSISLLVGK
jgi:hypothetical protein